MERFRIAIGGAFALTLLLSVGCEDTAVTPGEDATMSLVARPSAVLIDAAHLQGEASLVATVYSATGAPQSSVRVVFSTTAGTLASGNAGIETNGDGSAIDTLTIDDTAPAEITVTAIAGTLTQTTKVNKTGGNHAPTAVIVTTPASEAMINRSVTFDGSTSSDPDTGDTKTYDWQFASTAGAVNPSHAVSPSVVFPNGFSVGQTLTATLKVTDSHGLSNTVDKNYAIRDCATNPEPTALITAPASGVIQVTGTAGQSVPVQLSGARSVDSNGAIQTYTWTCGNGAVPSVSGSSATCNYVVSSTPHTYIVTLIVTDDGFGPPALVCPKQSPPVTVNVEVSTP